MKLSRERGKEAKSKAPTITLKLEIDALFFKIRLRRCWLKPRALCRRCHVQ